MLKNIFTLAAGISVALVFFGCASPVKNVVPARPSAANMRPVLQAGKTSLPPLIDGNLDDPCWKTAAMASGFVNLAGEWSRLQVICFMAYDDQCLYIAFDSTEEDFERLSLRPLPHDVLAIFENDTVELFLQPDIASGKYYHFAVNPAGSYYEARCQVERGSETERDEKWNPSWDRKVSKRSGHWITELAIPFSALIPPGSVPGMQWGLNLCRTRQGMEGSASSWAMARKGFNQPTEFGRMLFAPMPGVSYGIRSWGFPVFGEPLRLVVRNGMDRPCGVQPTWCFGYEGTLAFSKEAVRLAPREEREVSLPQRIKTKGDVTNDIPMSQFNFETRFDLIDPGAGTTWDQRAARLVLPSPFAMTLDRYYLDPDIHEIRVSLVRRISRGDRWILKIALEPNEAPLLSQTIPALTGAESAECAFAIQTLPCGRYVVSATLMEGDKQICAMHGVFFKCPAKFSSFAEGIRTVSIGEHGAFLVNGEPFCPFMASPGPQNLEPPFTLKSCFNVRYSSLGLVSNPMERVSLELGAFGREDGKTVIIWPEKSKIHEKVKTMVLARRSDTSLLYWFIMYEASIPLYRREGVRPIPLNNLEEYKKVHRLLKELDPGHFSAIHVDNPAVIDAYKDVADIIEVACGSSYARNLIPNLAADVARVRAQIGKDKPLIYWIGSSIPSAARRTAEETRCAVYLALMHGANGIVFHMGHDGIPPIYTRLWSVYDGLSGEGEQLYPILVSGDRLSNLAVTPGDSIDWCARQYRGKTYIVAVNSTGRLVKARFSIGSAAVSDGLVRVMFEERRIALDGNIFTDSFTAYEPHVYELLPVTPGGN